jgi:hypothetical protein
MILNGTLEKNETGRWEYADRELTCGDVVEIDIGTWIKGRIEHNGRDYYLLAPDGMTEIGLHKGLPARTPHRAGMSV